MLRQILTPVLVIFIFFVLLFAYTKLAGPIPFSVNSVSTTKTDVFTVSGEGVSSQKPDTAMVQVGVTASGATVKAAQDQLNDAINKVSESIKALGIDPKDIQTQNYNINPTYDFTSGQKVTGYTASTNLSVKVREIDKVNGVIDAATASGANQVNGVSFGVADREQAENEARQKAVDQAKKKAEQAARVAGFSLGKMINYTENFGGGVPPVMPFAAERAGGNVDTKVEPGSAEIKVTVTLSYQTL